MLNFASGSLNCLADIDSQLETALTLPFDEAVAAIRPAARQFVWEPVAALRESAQFGCEW